MFIVNQLVSVINPCQVLDEHLTQGLCGTVVAIIDVLGTPIVRVRFEGRGIIPMRVEEIEAVESHDHPLLQTALH